MIDIGAELRKDVPREYVTQRSGGGGIKLDYVSGRYVKQRLSELFGWDGWSMEVVRVQLFPEECTAFAHVRLTVGNIGDLTGVVQRDGLAYGHGRKGAEGFDFAIAEAVTDALKRAAVTLGQNLGLSLYPMAKGSKGDPGTQGPVERRDESVVMTSAEAQAYYGVQPDDGLADALREEVGEERESLKDGFARRLGEANSLADLEAIGTQIGAAPLSDADKEMLKDVYKRMLKRLS